MKVFHLVLVIFNHEQVWKFLEICESYCYFIVIFFCYCCSQKLCLLVLVSSPSGGYDFCCFAQAPVRHFCCLALFQFVLCLIQKTWVEVVSSLWTCQLKESSGLYWYLSVMTFPRFSQGFKISAFYAEAWEKSLCRDFVKISSWETRYNFRQLWLSELYVVLASKPDEWVMMLLFFLQIWIGFSLSIWIFRSCI